MSNIIIGIFCIVVALIPDPSYYFGEGFGVKIMPYWVVDLMTLTIGVLNVSAGLKELFS